MDELTIVFDAYRGYRLVLDGVIGCDDAVKQVKVEDLHRYLGGQLSELENYKKGDFSDEFEEPHKREDSLIFLILELSALGYLSFLDLNSLYTRLKKLQKARPYRMWYA